MIWKLHLISLTILRLQPNYLIVISVSSCVVFLLATLQYLMLEKRASDHPFAIYCYEFVIGPLCMFLHGMTMDKSSLCIILVSHM